MLSWPTPATRTGCHPTIDTQGTGWDKNWNVQAWNSGSSELLGGWKHVYAGICRANDFLENLKTYPEDIVDANLKKDLEGEGRAQNVYDILVNQFGVPASQLVKDSKGGVDYMYFNDEQMSRSVIISEVK